MSDDLITSRGHNAGQAQTPYDLDATLEAAQARANAEPRGALNIYQHVGGRHPKYWQVAATGVYMWRDLTDDDNVLYGEPKFVWAFVETVNPS